MNTQNVIDYLWNSINKGGEQSRKSFNVWKNNNLFFYAGIISNNHLKSPYSCLLYVFSNKDIDIKELTSLEDFNRKFNHQIRYKEVDDEIKNIFKEDVYKISVSEIPDWNFKVGSYQELLDAEVLEVESLEEMKNAISEYTGINKYVLKDLSDKYLEDLKIEKIYEKTDDNFKYGDITSRISYKGKVIGHFNRGGKWMDNYTYYTHDLNKWNEMLDYIIVSLNIRRNVDEYVCLFNKEDDIYDVANIKGYHDVDGGE